MSKQYQWSEVAHALRNVLKEKTTPELVDAIIEDLLDELEPAKGLYNE